eukprot:Cvel_24007.t1-p1 / transcript=Cvel_24007.t1 / gene=Cvel_24007 / organism=Chromera_velia_CCMP2878 / gene_product=hypothetical protein / transcript_product=hypothetical protein / location=Cvel_scaffold2545:25720-25951(+) / protein_length=77 / sequence_SO=supercontig / SO=protein_coding / is_pseudo=false
MSCFGRCCGGVPGRKKKDEVERLDNVGEAGGGGLERKGSGGGKAKRVSLSGAAAGEEALEILQETAEKVRKMPARFT